MKVSIFGTGYVGLVTGACLADVGHDIICVDVDEEKVANLNRGIIPIYEPGLESIVKSNFAAGNLNFTTDAEKAIHHAKLQFIAVGTPSDEDGSADLQYVLAVAKQIGEEMKSPLIVVDKSTVPVGTADKVRAEITKQLELRNVDIPFHVVSNPEFLKEGAAIDDFMKPDRVVIGADNDFAVEQMKALYSPFVHNRDRLIFMDVRSAEMTKYVANAMLATKISFMNEVANICELVDADVNQVRIGIGSDKRIGYSFIYPGSGYGGSCFPKDVKALKRMAAKKGYNAELITSVENVNDKQKFVIVNKIIKRFGEDLSGKTFALWGLAFKPGTDDMREAPSIYTVKELVKRGAKVNAYDPKAMEEAKHFYLKGVDGISYFETKYETLKNADAMILLTEWKEFRSPDFEEIKTQLTEPVIFDGRNQYDEERLNKKGFEYHQIGKK